jgi:molybdopterin synthase catalytic subunit
MRLVVRLFAAARDRAGADRLTLSIEGSSASLEELRMALERSTPALAPILAISRIAVNQEFAEPGARVAEGDEIAIIPPVSGGSGQGPFELRASPIVSKEVEDAVRAPGQGAVVSFAGTVRDRTGEHEVVALEYEAYPEMAERFLRKIGDEIRERWPGARSAILHRTGRLGVGEISVVIAVSSPHRAEAFDACRHAIERLKKDVPLWKKEIRKSGEIWVGTGS